MAVKPSTLLNAAVAQGLLSQIQMESVQQMARREGLDLQEAACLVGRFPTASMYRALASVQGHLFATMDEVTCCDDGMNKLPASILQRGTLAVVEKQNKRLLWVASADDRNTLDSVLRLTGEQIPIAMGEPEAIRALVNRWLNAQQRNVEDKVENRTTDFIGLLNAIFKQAWLLRASDVHLVAEKENYRVRYRVDGDLQDMPNLLSLTEGAGLLSRIKVLAGLDIAESREPQDGVLNHQVVKNKAFDVRVATMPSVHGERVTMRLMEGADELPSLESLGMTETNLAYFKRVLHEPHGIALITGPTGSGKSTTLYSGLLEVINSKINVLTVEDPVERQLLGATQVQVSSKVNFSDAIKSFLRHDPDVIMVGEIRDIETVDAALKASVTGHLVLSTLHTNSAPSAVTRLADLGAARFLIASTLRVVIAQRLARRLCELCKTQRNATPEECATLNKTDAYVWQPVGCSVCNGSGFKGRVGIFESLWIDNEVAKLIAAGADEADLINRAESYISLWQDGRKKVLTGMTTLPEILKLTNPE